MEEVLLLRENSDFEGTEGTIVLPSGISFFTLELQWMDNEPKRSCIPTGTYECSMRKSPKFGWTYHVKDVPDRSYILIHSGNFAGDERLGYKNNVLGCILLGKKRGKMEGQKAVFSSKVAVKEFMRLLDEKPFILTIKNKEE